MLGFLLLSLVQHLVLPLTVALVLDGLYITEN